MKNGSIIIGLLEPKKNSSEKKFYVKHYELETEAHGELFNFKTDSISRSNRAYFVARSKTKLLA